LAAGDTSVLGMLAEEQAIPISPGQASKFRTLGLVMMVVFLNSVGNVLLAWGMRHLAEAVSVNPLGYLRAMLNPFVAAGIVLLILWLLTRMALLSWADLSFVLPLTGLGYILTAALGKYVLSETVTAGHWIGTLLIFAGTAMVGTTRHQTGLGCEECK
jgi:drug/metabolite transporter (DMT)-like permease